MIVVIADDLSGAAELAGTAAKFGLRAEVQTEFDSRTEAELIAVDTNTRSLPEREAAQCVAEITRAIHAVKPAWIYKKTDSVLRGNVRAEIEAILGVTGQSRSVLIPANPSKLRIIRDGVYFVNGVPLAETSFARDPEHPRWTSRVVELLGLTATENSLQIPDVSSGAELAVHATQVNNETLPAGGVDFFEALLRKNFPPPPVSIARNVSRVPLLETNSRTLFVCGSAAAWDSGRAEECRLHDVAVVVMPDEIFEGAANLPHVMHAWQQTAAQALRERGRVMLAIGRSSQNRSPLAPQKLIEHLTLTTAALIASESIARILIEGGATASALLQRMKWRRLSALATELVGVAALRSESGPLLFIKPGSYPWPEEVWSRL